MKPASAQSLDAEQNKMRTHLSHALEQVNQADDLLAKNTNSDAASSRATALLLAAIARVFVIQTAERYNMFNRL